MVERVRRARWRDCPALKEAPGPPTGGLCHGGGAATENRAYAGAYFRARLQPSGNGLGRIAPHSGGACPQPLPRRIRLHRRRADVETAQWIRAALLGCSAFVRAFAGFACSPKFTAKQDTFSKSAKPSSQRDELSELELELELFAARVEAGVRFQPRAEARRLRHRVDGDGKWSL